MPEFCTLAMSEQFVVGIPVQNLGSISESAIFLVGVGGCLFRQALSSYQITGSYLRFSRTLTPIISALTVTRQKRGNLKFLLQLLHDLSFLTCLRCRLPVRDRYFDPSKQVHHLLRLVSLPSCQAPHCSNVSLFH